MNNPIEPECIQQLDCPNDYNLLSSVMANIMSSFSNFSLKFWMTINKIYTLYRLDYAVSRCAQEQRGSCQTPV
jgi:hypothetical protein